MELTAVGSLGLIFFVAGLMLIAVGFSRPYWITWDTSNYVNMGLWKYCTGVVCGDASDFNIFGDDGLPTWFKLSQAMACLSLIAVAVSLVMIILYIVGFGIGSDKKYLLFAIISSILTVTFGLCGATVFGYNARTYGGLKLGWCFAAFVVGNLGVVANVILSTMEHMRR